MGSRTNSPSVEDISPALTLAEARNGFSDLVNRVAYGKERIALLRRGKVVAMAVPVEDLERILAADAASKEKP